MANGTKICLILYNILFDGPDPNAEGFDSQADSRADVGDIRKLLREKGFETRTLGLRQINSKIIAKIEEINPDFIFNLCESLNGRSQAEMYVAGVLELLKIPYTGSPPLALGLGLNKMKTKQILYSKGLPTPKFVIAMPDEPFSLNALTPPYIVKPVREDGSAGISKDSVVNDLDLAMEKVVYIHQTLNQPAMIEEFIDGREFNVTVLDGEKEKLVAINEIDFSKLPKGEIRILSYESKWNPKSPLYTGTPLICPAEVESHLKAKIEKVAINVFKEIGCRDYARVDIRVSDKGRIYVLEVNPNPDIGIDSELSKSLLALGISCADWVERVANFALKRGSKEMFSR